MSEVALPQNREEAVSELETVELKLSALKSQMSGEILPTEQYRRLKRERWELVQRKIAVLEQLRRLNKWGDLGGNGDAGEIEFDDEGILLFGLLLELVRKGVLMTQLKSEDRELIEDCEKYLKNKKVEHP